MSLIYLDLLESFSYLELLVSSFRSISCKLTGMNQYIWLYRVLRTLVVTL